MLSKVLFTVLIFVFGFIDKAPATTCYSCEASDKHLPMSNCYFVTTAVNTTTCPSSCLFFQYIVLEEYTSHEYIPNENRWEDVIKKGNVAHTVRSCAPANINETCIVNSTSAVVRQCVACDNDLCNRSPRENIPAVSTLLILATAFYAIFGKANQG